MAKDTLESFSNKINSKFLFDYDLKKSNWFNIGGKAKCYFKPDTLGDLVLFLKKFGEKERVFVLGAGSRPFRAPVKHGLVASSARSSTVQSLIGRFANACRYSL